MNTSLDFVTQPTQQCQAFSGTPSLTMYPASSQCEPLTQYLAGMSPYYERSENTLHQSYQIVFQGRG